MDGLTRQLRFEERQSRRRVRAVDGEELPRAERDRLLAVAARLLREMPEQQLLRSADDILTYFSNRAQLFALPGNYEAGVLAERAAVAERLEALRRDVPRSTSMSREVALDRRLEWAGRSIGLDKLDREITKVLVRARTYEAWHEFLNLFPPCPGSSCYVRGKSLAAVLRVSHATIRNRLDRPSRLVSTGFVENHQDDDYQVSSFLCRIATMQGSDPAKMEAALLAPEPPSTLEWEDFEHLGSGRRLSGDLVEAASRAKKGVNLLLYGPPGAGKSEFARALADRAGLSAVFVGSADEEGNEPSRRERLAHFTLARSLTAKSRRHLLVVDEAEDLMFDPASENRTQNSKLWLNRFIEQSAVPTIWIVNDNCRLGGPVIRRMCMAVEFKTPPTKVRERVLRRHLSQAGMRLKDDEISSLAQIKLQPAVAAQAVTAAALTDQSADTVALVAEGIQRAMGQYESTPRVSCKNFDPSFSSADIDLSTLTTRLSSSGKTNWSLLLSGPSGAGKTVYARYLADRCGLEVLEKRASDLLDKYVGGTEKEIAAAFQESADTGAMLIIDEADSLLRNRETAERSWEASMVNEMLTWMERHPAPFVATTNLAEVLDPASARRFLFKVRFNQLDLERRRGLFHHYFGIRAPGRFDHVEGLSPADFAVVARRAELLEVTAPGELVRMLIEEVEAKPDYTNRRIGFGTAFPAEMRVPG